MAVHGTGTLVLLAILLLAVLTLQALVEGKTQNNFKQEKEDNSSRIIDHTYGVYEKPDLAKKGQFPWQVWVRITRTDKIEQCGGSIIDQEWIMTAAHCITDRPKYSNGLLIASGYEITATRVDLIAGVIDVNDFGKVAQTYTYDTTEIRAEGKDKLVFIHNDYNRYILYDKDIALFKLKTPLKFNHFVKPILLATVDVLIPGKKLSATATGWGKMAYDPWTPYQSGKFWNPDQCAILKEKTGVTLQKCMEHCAKNKLCQVFTYVATKTACALRTCYGPIPEPIGGPHPLTIGYFKNEKVSYAHDYGNFWTYEQCKKIEQEYTPTLADCEWYCIKTSKCTHFRYHESRSMCGLQRCESGIAEPEGSGGKWIGYSVYSVYEAHESGNFWTTGDQCVEVKNVNFATLIACMIECTNHKKCTHFRYNAEEFICVLQECQKDISKPSGTDDKWTGYHLPGWRPINWGKYRTIQQCPLVKLTYRATLEKCKRDCTTNDGCTEFFFKPIEKMCGLQGCQNIILPPDGIDSGYIGYVGEPSTQNLRYVSDLEIKSQKDCFATYFEKSTISETMICHQTPKKSVYTGDSGGPITLVFKNIKPPRYVQIGINSFTHPAIPYSAVFTDVAKLRPWIHSTMGGYSPNGFFLSSKRWYRLIKDERVNWREAFNICRYNGMWLVEPKDDEAVQLREDVIDQFGDRSEAWIGARGDGTKFKFVKSEATVPANSHLFPEEAIAQSAIIASGVYCLMLDASREGMDAHPKNPYYAIRCSGDNVKLYPLCESCKDSPVIQGCTITRDGSKQCKPKACPVNEDFFTQNETEQCFKILPQKATWEKADEECKKLNLTLAQPVAPVQLRRYLVNTYEPEPFVWLGACQDEPNKMTWKRGGEEIPFADPLWYPGQPDHDEGCLLLLARDDYLEKEPKKPFWNVLPKHEFYPLCEMVLE